MDDTYYHDPENPYLREDNPYVRLNPPAAASPSQTGSPQAEAWITDPEVRYGLAPLPAPSQAAPSPAPQAWITDPATPYAPDVNPYVRGENLYVREDQGLQAPQEQGVGLLPIPGQRPEATAYGAPGVPAYDAEVGDLSAILGGAPRRDGRRVLMTTEGGFPYKSGGVSTWCNILMRGLSEFSWTVLPIMAGGFQREPKAAPPDVNILPTIELWAGPPGGWHLPAGTGSRTSLPSEIAAGILGWDADPVALTDALVWCRRNPERLRTVFRSRAGWEGFQVELQSILDEKQHGMGPTPELAMSDVATLYQAMYWVARTAAVPTPETDVLMITGAGWAGIPSIVHKALHGTPYLLIEHGLYVREAYMGATKDRPGSRYVRTRLARGLTRAAYAAADIVTPVTDANSEWEEALGLPPDYIYPIYNGTMSAPDPTPPPGVGRIISLGRLDPIKDIHTMLRVAAIVTEEFPSAQFLYYGPSWPPVDAYGRSCRALHARLNLGDRFKFMGPTEDPRGALRSCDMLAMTSISEGLPMSILEAMAEGRPVVATSVGGIPEVVKGCGFVAPPGDAETLAMGILTMLRHPDLARSLGRRGYARLGRRYSQAQSLQQYRDLLGLLAAPAA